MRKRKFKVKGSELWQIDVECHKKQRRKKK